MLPVLGRLRWGAFSRLGLSIFLLFNFGQSPGEYTVQSNHQSEESTPLFNQLSSLTTTSSSAQLTDSQSENIVRIEAHAPGVYRLRFGLLTDIEPERVTPRMQELEKSLLLRVDAVGELQNVAEYEKGCWRFEQGELALELCSEPFGFRLLRGDQLLVQSQDDGIKKNDSWSLALDLSDDELLFGLGEITDKLERRGCKLLSSNPADRSVPFVWSTQGWGLYINTFETIEHDVACTNPDVYQAQVHTDYLDIFLFTGAPTDIFNQYTALTGRAGQPGLWPMGVWLHLSPEQSIDEGLQLIDELAEQGLGIDVMHLPAPLLYGFSPERSQFEWDEQRMGDFRATLQKADEANIKLVAPTFPAVLVDTPLFEEWDDRGWLLIDDDLGYSHTFKGNELTGGKDFGLLDLTYNDAYRLWVERQRQTFDEGLGAPVDFSDFELPDNLSGRGGQTGEQLRTLYPMLMRQALFDAYAGHKTPQEGVLPGTAIFPSVQRYAWQMGPEVTNDWQGMRLSLASALSTGNAGICAQTHYLGSPNAPLDDMTPELYVRWLSMLVFSANFHMHAVPGLMPSDFDKETQEYIHHWFRWRYRLVPYVLGIIEESVRSGLPVQRALSLEFPDDPEVLNWSHQYMLGSALLVVPFMQPGDEIEVYLPKGTAWWDLSTGWRYEGGTRWTVQAGLDKLPVFGREGHMLCLGPEALNTSAFNSARLLEEVWMFGMPEQSPEVMRNKIRVMQMQGSSYIKGLEGLKILPSEGLEVKRRGAEVRISRER